MKIASYIEGKLEEFRISGKSPAKWLGLTPEVHRKLSDELRPKLRPEQQPAEDAVLTAFLGMVIIPVAPQHMPDDGVYIHDADSSELWPFPTARKA